MARPETKPKFASTGPKPFQFMTGATPSTSSGRPQAPPVYRPNLAAPQPRVQPGPQAPPIYRPLRDTAMQLKDAGLMAKPPVYRPQPPSILPKKMAPRPLVLPGRAVPSPFPFAQSVQRRVIQRVNAGRPATGQAYVNDLLRGGPDTIKVKLATLIELWDPNQRDNGIHEPAVSEYVALIAQGGHIDAPFVDSIKLSDGAEIVIRTSEGRHRIKAAERAGKTSIYILKPAEESLTLLSIMGVELLAT